MIDLGVHLIDLALWVLDFPGVGRVSADFLSDGEPLSRQGRAEDYAIATLDLETGAVARIACSWNRHPGFQAQISAAVHGRGGGATMRNVGGSLYYFTAQRYGDDAHETLDVRPDDWEGRAAKDWAVPTGRRRVFRRRRRPVRAGRQGPRPHLSALTGRCQVARVRRAQADSAITLAEAIMSAISTYSSGWWARSRMPGP